MPGFNVPEGWTLENTGNARSLTGPEGDLRIDFIEIPAIGSISEIALSAWKSTAPDFDSKVLREVSLPPQSGWDEMHQMVYEVPARESRLELAVVRKLDNRAFVNLVRGSMAAVGRRGAQLNEVVGSWVPPGLTTVSLKGRPAKLWTAALTEEFSEFITVIMAQLQVPGVAIALVQNGEVVFSEGFGVRALGDAAPVTPKTRFMIGSTTKALTSLLMARLIDEGKVSWKTPVVELLPEFSLADPGLTRRLELHHTVSASTGMPRRDVDFVFRYTGITPEDRIRQMKSMLPTTGFGETFQYSNFLVAAGGYAVARAFDPGVPLAEAFDRALAEHVFLPLGMNDSALKQEDALQGEAALPHALTFEGAATRIPLKTEQAIYTVAPAGAVWSTVEDIAKYVQFELSPNLPASVLQRREKGIKIDKDSSYGLGLIVGEDSGVAVIQHGGNTFGFTSDMFFLPENNFGAVVLTNTGAANAFTAAVRQKLFELLLGGEAQAELTVVSAAKMREEGIAILRGKIITDPTGLFEWPKELVGRYVCEELGNAEITSDSDGFHIAFDEWSSNLGFEVQPGGDRLLRIVSAPWRGGLRLLVDSEIKALILDQGQAKYIWKREIRG